VYEPVDALTILQLLQGQDIMVTIKQMIQYWPRVAKHE